MARRVPQIEVTLQLDVNNILVVTAEEKSGGKSQSLTITNDANRLSQEDIERMIQESEKYKEADQKALEVTTHIKFHIC